MCYPFQDYQRHRGRSPYRQKGDGHASGCYLCKSDGYKKEHIKVLTFFDEVALNIIGHTLVR